MIHKFEEIESQRLLLRLMPRPTLKALAKGNVTKAAAVLEVDPDDGLLDLQRLAAMRLRQLTADPAYMPWSIRALVLKGTRTAVGYCNFHAAPGDEALARHGRDAVEIGYTIFPAHQCNGYAFEAVSSLVAWAGPQGVRTLVLSISPDNAPSLRIAAKLGAVQVGEQIDEEDGLEYVFAARLP